MWRAGFSVICSTEVRRMAAMCLTKLKYSFQYMAYDFAFAVTFALPCNMFLFWFV
jgi:hypothetical protein